LDTLFIALQHLLPQHLLSRLVGAMARARAPAALVHWVIRRFIAHFKVDMSEAAASYPEDYASFNAFFTRPLAPGARPLDPDPAAVSCPADGAISQIGHIHGGRILQAKGRGYSVTALLGGDSDRAQQYTNGRFATIYLSPRDYHRVHMPLAGRLLATRYVPGDLFSVNRVTAERVDHLFARNERLVCHFETAAGPMAVVLVGAMIVAGIETVWSGQEAPVRRAIRDHDYSNPPAPVALERGAELGRFLLGSTVILLFGDQQLEWRQELRAGSPTRMGESMAILTGGATSR